MANVKLSVLTTTELKSLSDEIQNELTARQGMYLLFVILLFCYFVICFLILVSLLNCIFSSGFQGTVDDVLNGNQVVIRYQGQEKDWTYCLHKDADQDSCEIWKRLTKNAQVTFQVRQEVSDGMETDKIVFLRLN